MFEDFLATSSSGPSTLTQVQDELEDYLRTGPENLKYKEKTKEKVMTPLEWWVRHRDVYPKLSRMALDYLSIPGMC